MVLANKCVLTFRKELLITTFDSDIDLVEFGLDEVNEYANSLCELVCPRQTLALI